MKIEFDSEKHIYTVDGEIYPSVTQIIESSGLVDSTWFTEESAKRGKDVHKICELYDEGTLDYNSVDDSYIGYTKAYELFSREVNPDWFFIEKKVACKLTKFAGTLDRQGQMFDKYVICDIKTGTPHPAHGLQLAAYRNAFNPFLAIKRYGLYLNKDGSYKLVTYSDMDDLKMFKCACALWHWKKWKGVI